MNSSSCQKKIIVMTHSTSGMLVWPSINRHPDWFSNWISVAGTHGPGLVLSKDLRNGWFNGNMCILSPETLFTFPSMCGFFPVYDEDESLCETVDSCDYHGFGFPGGDTMVIDSCSDPLDHEELDFDIMD